MYLLGNQIAGENVMFMYLRINIKGLRLSEWKTKHHEFLTLCTMISWLLPDKFYVRYSKRSKHLLLINNACRWQLLFSFFLDMQIPMIPVLFCFWKTRVTSANATSLVTHWILMLSGGQGKEKTNFIKREPEIL